MHIEGYVNAVGRDSRPIPSPRGLFVEQVAPGTFANACKSHAPRLLHNHKRALTAETELHEDNIGLHIVADIRDPTISELARRGELRGWSFGFNVRSGGETWEDGAQPYPRRTLTDIDLYEVSLIDSDMLPCYAGTSVEVRGESEELFELRGVFDDNPGETGKPSESLKPEPPTPESYPLNQLDIERKKFIIFKEMHR